MNHSQPLSGKTALVTGASRGLGRAIALALGQAGANVVVTDLLVEDDQPDKEKLSEYSILAAHFYENSMVRTLSTSRDIENMGVGSMALKMDVTDEDNIRNVVAQVEDTLGGVDILVNNAAVMDGLGLMENQSLKTWERDLRVNLTGTFLCTHAVWAGMKRNKWGRIINMSSFTAESGAFAQPGYAASKAGMLGLTRTLALEGAAHGMTVNAVMPGFIATEAIDLYSPDMKERICKRNPMKRMGTPDEVASLVCFLASKEASYLNGAAIPVTGGMDLLVF
ncbi:MAG: SDR family oxidoreductase [Proteobacteria bacterium]|nr:SDR family oxidoreductase [Pseudomonadota bacterium]